MPTVYLLTFASGKQYVGATNNLPGRMAAHKSTAKHKPGSHPMYAEWPPVIQILAKCTPKFALLIEKSFIQALETSVPKGYNKHAYISEIPRRRHNKQIKSYSWHAEWLQKHAS